MDNESLRKFGIDAVQQNPCLVTLAVLSALLTQKYQPKIPAFNFQGLIKTKFDIARIVP